MTDSAIVSRAIVVFASFLSVTGCSSQSSVGDGNAEAGGASPTASVAADSAAIDACALLSAQDISALLGTAVAGRSTSTDPTMPGCIWENPDTYESIAVEVGNPGSAANNTLPPPEPGFPDVGTPGPDGMRFLVPGQVEFPAGGRSNMVQVAVMAMSDEEANAAAVDLARKIGPLIPR